jgi:hypothetical protein
MIVIARINTIEMNVSAFISKVIFIDGPPFGDRAARLRLKYTKKWVATLSKGGDPFAISFESIRQAPKDGRSTLLTLG